MGDTSGSGCRATIGDRVLVLPLILRALPRIDALDSDRARDGALADPFGVA